MRYENATERHTYRLNFAIPSSVNHQCIGIELSPWSSHGRVTGKKKLEAEGGKGAVDKKQIEQWEKDSAKRTDYFTKFGITTITMTNQKLADIAAFESITPYLGPSIDVRRSTP